MSKKSNVTYLHEVNTKEIHDGKKIIHEEQVIHGDKGLMIKYYHKEGNDIEKIVIVKKDDGYSVRVKKGEKMVESMMSKEELIKMLSKNKDLKFATEYLKTTSGGKRKSKSKKSSKKKRSKKSKK